MLYAPGCPEPTAIRALMESARRFCRDSYIIQRTLDPIQITADTFILELNDEVDRSVEVIAVRSVTVDGQAVEITPEDFLRSRRAHLDNPPVGKPRSAWLEGENTLHLFPTSDDDYEVFVKVCVSPTAEAKVIDDELGNRWKDGVIGGAIERVCVVPGQLFSSATMATYGQRMYAESVGKARIEANRSFSRTERVALRPAAFGRKTYSF